MNMPIPKGSVVLCFTSPPFRPWGEAAEAVVNEPRPADGMVPGNGTDGQQPAGETADRPMSDRLSEET
jgi:hypothetical protein